jgi:hypothetical protein
LNFCELLVSRLRQPTKTIGRKANYAPVMQFDVNCSSLCPRAHASRFYDKLWLIDYGAH